MSKSLKLFNGDLVIGDRRSYQTVSGQAKMLQDLRLYLLEHVGTDPFWPDLGSRLDGGFADGQPVGSYIGQVATPSTAIAVRDEVLRVVQTYQISQMEKFRRELTQYQNTTLTADEIIRQIVRVEAIPAGDMILVKVTLQTGANQNVSLLVPLGA